MGDNFKALISLKTEEGSGGMNTPPSVTVCCVLGNHLANRYYSVSQGKQVEHTHGSYCLLSITAFEGDVKHLTFIVYYFVKLTS